ncbi:MAG: diguanylate cyclase [Pirellulaceae bacterium]|nr:diguanylate cyclase [Pirellulaceae bacterium]
MESLGGGLPVRRVGLETCLGRHANEAMTDNTRLQLLLVENDAHAASMVRKTLEDHFPAGNIICCATCTEAVAVDLNQIDLVLSVMDLPDGTGLELLASLLGQRPDLPVVLVTDVAVMETAVEAIRRGAYDYIIKTGDYLFAIPLVVEKNLAIWRTKQENLRLAGQVTRTLEQVRIKNHQLESLVHELETMAATDPLTGLVNRRAFGKAMEQSFAECTRYDHDLACIMIDLDRFKQLNDTLGHQRGDEVLQRTARVLQAYCRQCDIAGRFGGDEFILLLPETNAVTAENVARRIGEKFATDTAQLCGGDPSTHRLAMSMGLATLSLTKPSSPEQLIAHADNALYRAKQTNSTCVVVSGSSASQTNPVQTDRSARTSSAPPQRASLSTR